MGFVILRSSSPSLTSVPLLLIHFGSLLLQSLQFGFANAQTLAVSNGTARYRAQPSCGSTLLPPIPSTDRLIYDSYARISLFGGDQKWAIINTVDSTLGWVGGGQLCFGAALVCQAGLTSRNDYIVSPYFGNISDFAPSGLPAVRIVIDYQIQCQPNLSPCSFNVVPIWARPLNYLEPVNAAALAQFTRIGELNPGVANSSSTGLDKLPFLQHTIYYPLPLATNGFYLALQSRGACIRMGRFQVSYQICPAATIQGIQLKETVSKATDTPVTGVCSPSGNLVANDTLNGGQVMVQCNPDGAWRSSSAQGQCVCVAGYGRASRSVSCTECLAGFYKALPGDRLCDSCPRNSDSGARAVMCSCMTNYYRDTSPVDGVTAESINNVCTMPPLQLQAGQIVADNTTSTAIEFSWTGTRDTGGRSDVSYDPSYQRDGAVQWITANTTGDMMAVINGLLPFTDYNVRVFVRNGVSDEANIMETAGYSITVKTRESVPGMPQSITLRKLAEGVRVVFEPPATPNGVIRGYIVVLMQVGTSLTFTRNVSMTARSADFEHLTDVNVQYAGRVQAYTSAGSGDFAAAPSTISPGPSDFMPPTTTPIPSTATTSPGGKDASSDMAIIIGAVSGGVIFVVIVLILIIIIVYVKTKDRRQAPYRVSVTRHDSEKPKVSIFRRRSSSVKSNVTIDLSSSATYSPAATLTSQVALNGSSKQFVDPLIYADVSQALSEFTKEVNPSFVHLKSPIGEGEFAQVWQGQLKVPGHGNRVVAVKVLKDASDYRVKNDFLMEACIMGQFQCPNIVALIGICSKERNRPAMILTEYMENGSLDHYLQNHDGQFSPKVLLKMGLDAACGMEYLSRMGFIHRDLAARNILMAKDLVCKVSDFGLSREADDDNAYEVKHGGKLPIRWTAPEAIQYRKFTSQSDVWSYGIMMWEIMSYGERPYWDWGNSEVMEAVTQQKYRLPPPMRCPNVIHGLMLECWNKDRTQRPTFPQIRRKVELMLEGDLPVENLVPKQPVDREAPPVSLYSAIGDWLKSMQLSQYTENFTSCGYAQVSQCLEITVDDLGMLGITLPAHQKKIIANLQTMENYKG